MTDEPIHPKSILNEPPGHLPSKEDEQRAEETGDAHPPSTGPLATLTMSGRQEMSTAWMISLADLLALVLTFFVLLYSMTVIRYEPWEEVIQSLSQRLNPRPLEKRPVPTEPLSTPGIEHETAENLDYLYGIINEKIRREPLFKASIQKHEDRLVISLESDVFFHAGHSRLQKEVLPTLAALGNTLGQIENRIDVYGHTDPRPINSKDFPSNWELSLSRAVTIATAIKDAGYKGTVRSYGLADARFTEISQDLNLQARYSLSRRVDVVVRGYLPDQ